MPQDKFGINSKTKNIPEMRYSSLNSFLIPDTKEGMAGLEFHAVPTWYTLLCQHRSTSVK